MKITQRVAIFMASILAMFATMVSNVSAAIDTVNLTADINAALDVFWLIPTSIVDNFGTLITLILFGAIIGLISIILVFLKKVLGRSTESGGNIGK